MFMKIIIPPHKKISKEVLELTDNLKKDIEGMKELVRVNKFENGRMGYAVAHCQVSEDPYKIFVAVQNILSNSVVINPRILEKSEPYTVKELCLSFPYRSEIKVRRYNKIKVKYLDEQMEEHEEELEGIKAQIFQHEIQHFSGRTIYDK